MKKFCRILYSFLLVYLLYAGFMISALFSPKTMSAFFGRLGIWRRYRQGIGPKTNKKRIWIHVSSAGELEQAKPLIRLFHERNTDEFEMILTYFSPSAKKPASNIQGISFSDYLPLDTYFNTKNIFNIIQPDAVIFVKFDIWPNIVWEAEERGIPTILIDGTLQRKSMRYSNLLGQSFYNTVYIAFKLIGVVSESDLRRFIITCSKHQDVKILGDTRFDQVAFRATQNDPHKLPMSMQGYKDKLTIICGSTWEADDKHILKPLRDLLEDVSLLNIILVPHEPTQKHIQRYMEYFAAYAPVRLSDIRKGAKGGRVVLVDEVGCLAELYRIASVAYVGGAFSTGVHNVMEPSIMGLPTIFGPIYYNSPEAEALVMNNCAFSGSDSEDFYTCFKKLACDVNFRLDAGRRAQEFIRSNIGADEKYYKEINRLI